MTERREENALSEAERLELAERLRLAFDTPPEERMILDTWVYAAATAEQFFVERTIRRRRLRPEKDGK